MSAVTVEEAQARLPELIDKLTGGAEVVITRNAVPVARLVRPAGETPRPVFGRGKGKVAILAEEEAHLKGFEDYMP